MSFMFCAAATVIGACQKYGTAMVTASMSLSSTTLSHSLTIRTLSLLQSPCARLMFPVYRSQMTRTWVLDTDCTAWSSRCPWVPTPMQATPITSFGLAWARTAGARPATARAAPAEAVLFRNFLRLVGLVSSLIGLLLRKVTGRARRPAGGREPAGYLPGGGTVN